MSRMVRDREQLAERVARVVAGVLDTLAELLDAIYAPLLEDGETLDDPVSQLRLDLRLVEERSRRMRELQEAYRESRLGRKRQAAERDRLAAELHDRVAGLRKIVDGEHGSGGSAELLGIRGRTRRKHEPLLGQIRSVLLHLRAIEDNPGLWKLGADGRPLDAAAWRSRIESPYEALAEAAQAALNGEQLVVQRRLDRDRAVAAADEARRHLVNATVSYCKLVGRDDLAERVRRFSRQRGRPGPRPGGSEDEDDE
jgi:hypothetical protein